MRIPRLAIISSTVLATTLALAAPPSARAWITQTTDNSPTPTPWFPAQWWHWRTKPKAPPPPCRSKYCPPYYSETHGYTPPQWRPWPGAEQKMTSAPKADVTPPAEGAAPTKSTAAPTALPEAAEATAQKK